MRLQDSTGRDAGLSEMSQYFKGDKPDTSSYWGSKVVLFSYLGQENIKKGDYVEYLMLFSRYDDDVGIYALWC